MLEWYVWALVVLYVFLSVCLMVFGLNSYVLMYLFGKKQKPIRKDQQKRREDFLKEVKREGESHWPMVTTQIPLYNELNVAERVIRAVAAIEYPEGRHQIQVVDDSIDSTKDLVAKVVAELSEQGVWIEHCRRKTREGYKAGALKEAMEESKGEFIAIFDGDFVPNEDYLYQLIPLFDGVGEKRPGEKKTAVVQGRWGHLNSEESILTRAQTLGIDGHFGIEQMARSANGLYLNFNGTAGVWRKEAIIDAGNWEGDTLTEDLDLSYRAQLKGWHIEYAIDVVVPAELPETFSALKSQQFRWAKGSIQTAKKLLFQVLTTKAPLLAKVQSIFHMLHYMSHVLVAGMALLALPLSFLSPDFKVYFYHLFFLVPMILASFGPTLLYALSQRVLAPDEWLRKLLYLPAIVSFGLGICISNSKGVIEALFGVESGFVRTPKRGTKEKKYYRARVGWVPYVEVIAAVYSAATCVSFLMRDRFVGAAFFLIFTIGFAVVGGGSLMEKWSKHRS